MKQNKFSLTLLREWGLHLLTFKFVHVRLVVIHNVIVLVILRRIYPTIPQEYLGRMTFFLFENIGYF